MTPDERKARAVRYHAAGYNCCQSVLLACGDLTGLDETIASVGYGFAGGMYCGEVCGAVTGGLMAIGACLPGESIQKKRPLAAVASKEFEAMYQERIGALLCREILRNNGKRICDTCIACGAEAAGEIIEKLKRGETK